MTTVRAGAWVFLLLMGGAAISLSGCSEGESIPLVPSGALCERPLDPAWHQVSGICGNDSPKDALWPTNRMPVVVGEDGLILESDSHRDWSAINPLSEMDLYTLVENSDGVLVAAGAGGTVLFSPEAGQWYQENTVQDIRWRGSCSDGRRIWLAGDDGALATTVPGEAWEFFEAPETVDLKSVCAFGDSVFVGGSGGFFQVMVAGQWQDQTFPEISNSTVDDVLRLADGRLLVGAGRLLIRQESGWDTTPELGEYNVNGGIRLRDGFLWVKSNQKLLRFDTTTSPWPESEYHLWFNSEEVAPGPGNQVFTATYHGQLIWMDRMPDGSLDLEADQEGDLGAENLIRFQDGTVVFPGWLGLYEVTGTGSRLVSGFDEEISEAIDMNSEVAGQSLADFYLEKNNGLLWCRNGVVSMTITLPEGMNYVDEMKIDPEGTIWVSNNDGLAGWDGAQWTFWPTLWNNDLFVTREGTIILKENSNEIAYLGSTGMVPLELPISALGVSEPEPGILSFISPYFEETWWQMGTGATNTRFVPPMPECDELRGSASRETADGLLMATRGYSMVVKRQENHPANHWELVAGPCMTQISDLQELEDGGLVALGEENGVILVYSPSPF